MFQVLILAALIVSSASQSEPLNCTGNAQDCYCSSLKVPSQWVSEYGNLIFCDDSNPTLTIGNSGTLGQTFTLGEEMNISSGSLVLVEGGFSVNSDGVLRIEIGSSGSGELNVSRTMEIGGTLVVNVLLPSISDGFAIDFLYADMPIYGVLLEDDIVIEDDYNCERRLNITVNQTADRDDATRSVMYMEFTVTELDCDGNNTIIIIATVGFVLLLLAGVVVIVRGILKKKEQEREREVWRQERKALDKDLNEGGTGRQIQAID